MTPLSSTTGPFYRPAAFGLDPQNAGTVYLGTDSYDDGHSKGLWKTTDCAASWVHISTGRNGDAIDGGRNWTFAIDPNNSQVMYMNSGYYKLGIYKSTDGGVDWDDITPTGDGAPGFVSHIRMDPENSAHLLLDWHSNCGPWADGIGCFAESTDAGATWVEHYGTPSWPGQVVVWMLHGKSWVIGDNGIQLTTDGGVTWNSVTGSGAGGHSAGGLYRAVDGSYYLGTQDGVVRASSDAKTWDLVPGTGTWGLFVTGNDTDLYLSTSGGFRTSRVTDGLKWTDMPGSPKSFTACSTAYDADHHLIYASCLDQGFWRMRTE
jgi:photosystem II stability/assembly factor-like uncharacterized protein